MSTAAASAGIVFVVSHIQDSVGLAADSRAAATAAYSSTSYSTTKI